MNARRRDSARQRGMVAIGVVLALVLLSVVVVAAVIAGARRQDVTASRVRSTRALYAAEAGLNMAFRELMSSTDEDGDGGIGSVSDDDDDENDPAVPGARFRVGVSSSGSQVTITSEGRSEGVSRRLSATLEL